MSPVPAVLFPLCLFEYSSFQSLTKEKKKRENDEASMLPCTPGRSGFELNEKAKYL